MNKSALFSSKKQTWRTPQWLFDCANSEFGPFEFDAAATKSNSLCKKYPKDAFREAWKAEHVWCNPPYRKIGTWVQRAEDMLDTQWCDRIVFLLPARTDRPWFLSAWKMATHAIFVCGRLRFRGADNLAPFPSVLLVCERRFQKDPPTKIRFLNSKDNPQKGV